VQIIVAVIGVVGSLGVAYVTTGAAFESKLRAESASVSQLRDSVRAVATQLSGQLRHAEEEIAKLNATLATARTGVTGLTLQVDTVRAKLQFLKVNPALYENVKKRPDD
jgi:hypothetical protein